MKKSEISVRESKKADHFFDQLFCAPQVRLELTTYGLTVRRSNQLSY